MSGMRWVGRVVVILVVLWGVGPMTHWIDGVLGVNRAEAAAGKAKRLEFALGVEPVMLDPQDANDNVSQIICENVFQKLVDFDEKMNPSPELAERWELRDNGLTWIFFLRKNVTFHDGTPFNADAVRVSFERILNPDNKLARHSLFAPYVGKVEVRDASTVVFRMKKPLGSFLNHLSHIAGAIISPASLKKYGKDIARNPVGTGPFMFKEWVSGDHVTLVKNAGYWGEKAKLDELVMRPIPEGSARLLALETGEVDLVYPVPVTDIQRLKKSNDLEVVVGPTNRVIFIGIKTTKKPYDDVRVRQALNYAVDKKALVDKILMGYARAADSPVAPLTTGYSKTYSYDFNPEKAKQLLREAGVAPGTKIELWTPQGRYPMDRQVAEVIQSNLTSIGFEVNLQRWEWAAYNKEIRAKEKSNYGLYLLGSLPSTNDVNQALYNHFYTGLADNFYLFSNPAVDKLLLEAQAEPNAGKRKALFDQVQKLITDEAPRIFLFSVDQAIGIRKGVKGVRIWPIELITFEAADKIQ